MIRGLEKTLMQLQFVYSVFGFLVEKKDFFFFIWMRWIRSMDYERFLVLEHLFGCSSLSGGGDRKKRRRVQRSNGERLRDEFTSPQVT